MVVGDGVGEEIMYVLITHLQPHLCAAEVGFVLVAEELHIGRKDTLQVATDLHQCVVAQWQFAMDSDPYARLKMRGQFVSLAHRQRQCTMGKEHFID